MMRPTDWTTKCRCFYSPADEAMARILAELSDLKAQVGMRWPFDFVTIFLCCFVIFVIFV